MIYKTPKIDSLKFCLKEYVCNLNKTYNNWNRDLRNMFYVIIQCVENFQQQINNLKNNVAVGSNIGIYMCVVHNNMTYLETNQYVQTLHIRTDQSKCSKQR